MGQIVPVAEGWKNSSPGRYTHDSGGRLINGYAEKADPNGKMQYPVYPIGGLTDFVTLTSGGVWRGGIEVASELDSFGYVISGTNVDKIEVIGDIDSPTIVKTYIGDFPGSDRVFMAHNRKSNTPQVAVVANGLAYIIEDDAIAPLGDNDLPSPSSVTFVGGYFIFTIPDGRVFITSIDEGTEVDALDFATAEAAPDGLLVGYAVRQEVALFGTRSIEFWAQTAETFPFTRIPGTTVNKLGLLCKYSVADLNDVPFFVATDGTVRMLDGYQPVRVSTHDVERAIESIDDKDTITATAFPYQGHQFYILSSPSWTWAYDALTGLWHERESYGETRWRGEGYLNIRGKRVVGDFEANKLYTIEPDTYTEAGTHLIWRLRTPPIHAFPHALGFDRIFLDMIPGVGLNSSDDHVADPKVMLSWSDNGGKVFGTELTASVGQIGEFSRRVRFERLGQSGEDGRIFDISMSAAVIRGITGASVEVELLEP